jgi:hypothetical protein
MIVMIIPFEVLLEIVALLVEIDKTYPAGEIAPQYILPCPFCKYQLTKEDSMVEMSHRHETVVKSLQESIPTRCRWIFRAMIHHLTICKSRLEHI